MEREGPGAVLRFAHAFSLGGGAGITLKGSWESDLGDFKLGGTSSFPNTSFSTDFSLSLRRETVEQ